MIARPGREHRLPESSREGPHSHVDRLAVLRAPRQGIVAGLAAGWLALALLVWAYGDSPRAIAGQLFAGTWGMPYGIGQVLYKATPLLLTGVAVDLALRAGLFNIGRRGAARRRGARRRRPSGARLPPATPGWLALPAVIAVALAAGRALGGVPALLRARFGAHEVISTIMMNRIADAAVGLALARGLAIPGTARTPDVVARRAPRAARGPGAALDARQRGERRLAARARRRRARRGVARALARRPRDGPGRSLARGVRRRAHSGRAARRRRPSCSRARSAGSPRSPRCSATRATTRAASARARASAGIAVALLGRRSVVGLVLAALFFGTLEQGGWRSTRASPWRSRPCSRRS